MMPITFSSDYHVRKRYFHPKILYFNVDFSVLFMAGPQRSTQLATYGCPIQRKAFVHLQIVRPQEIRRPHVGTKRVHVFRPTQNLPRRPNRRLHRDERHRPKSTSTPQRRRRQKPNAVRRVRPKDAPKLPQLFDEFRHHAVPKRGLRAHESRRRVVQNLRAKTLPQPLFLEGS